MPENWCLQTVVLKTPGGPLDSKEIKPINLKGDQPSILTGRADAKAEAPVFWSSDVNRWVIEKSLMPGKIKRWDGWTASLMQWTWTWANWEMVRDRRLACCSPWGLQEVDTLGDWKTTATILRPRKDGPPLSWLLVYVQGLADSKVSVNDCWMSGYKYGWLSSLLKMSLQPLAN